MMRTQELQCDVTIETSIVRDEDEPEGTLAEFLSELVLPDRVA